MFQSILDFFSPPYCVNCQALGNFLCENCFEKIIFLKEQFCPECSFKSTDGQTHPGCLKPLGLNGHLSVCLYQGPIKSLIHHFKYGRFPVKNLSLVLEQILNLYFTSEEDYFAPQTPICPVPLYWWRQNQRGFNQALILAQILAKLWQLKLTSDFLKRTRLTLPQAKLSKKERVENVQGLFAINSKFKNELQGQTIILVDDVYTTGATLKECARVLKEEGRAREVYAVTLAYDKIKSKARNPKFEFRVFKR